MHPTVRHRGSVILEVLVVLGVLAVLAVVVFTMLRHTTTASWDSRGRQAQCMSNVRQQLVVIQMYQQDHNGKYPVDGAVWSNVSIPANATICPTYGKSKGIAYGYNHWVSGKTSSSRGMPPQQSLVVLADSAKPDHLLKANVDIDPRHTGKAVLGYADGHVALMAPSAAGITPTP